MSNEEIQVTIFGDPAEVPELEADLARQGCRSHRLASREELFATLKNSSVDVVLLILSKGHPERLALLQTNGLACELPPVVVITDLFDVDLYVEALRRGVFDGLGVPLDRRELLRVVRAAAAERRSQEKELVATA